MADVETGAASKPYHHGDLRQALIDAALSLMAEEQDWTFSLRQVARRAGVSHNAPYNHFAEKRDLLAAVAASGFEELRERMLAGMAGAACEKSALLGGALAYVRQGVENPALYRLMFGPALGGGPDRPLETRTAAAKAKTVLQDIILRGAKSGAFSISPDNQIELAMASIFVWSAVHGFTMLVLDDRTGLHLKIDDMTEMLMRALFEGLIRRS